MIRHQWYSFIIFAIEPNKLHKYEASENRSRLSLSSPSGRYVIQQVMDLTKRWRCYRTVLSQNFWQLRSFKLLLSNFERIPMSSSCVSIMTRNHHSKQRKNWAIRIRNWFTLHILQIQRPAISIYFQTYFENLKRLETEGEIELDTNAYFECLSIATLENRWNM